jgi:hypothetical protein
MLAGLFSSILVIASSSIGANSISILFIFSSLITKNRISSRHVQLLFQTDSFNSICLSSSKAAKESSIVSGITVWQDLDGLSCSNDGQNWNWFLIHRHFWNVCEKRKLD